jgi:hypothetical protein
MWKVPLSGPRGKVETSALCPARLLSFGREPAHQLGTGSRLRNGASLDRAHDPWRPEPGESASLGDCLLGGGVEDVEASLVSREERRADVADGFSLPRELPCRCTHALTGRARVVRVRPRNVGLDEVPRHL